MIGVREHDLSAESSDLGGMQRLDRRLRADRHENGSFDRAATGVDSARRARDSGSVPRSSNVNARWASAGASPRGTLRIVRWRSTIALPSWNADRALAWLVVARLEAAIARTLQRIGPVPLLTDDAAAVDFDAPFEAATLTAGASPTLSRKETSARGSFFEATALISAVFAAVPVLAELTEDVVEDDVVEEVFAAGGRGLAA